MSKTQVNIRLSEHTRQQLKKLAQVMEMTEAEVISSAIERLAQAKYRAWHISQANDYDPAMAQDGDYEFENWIKSPFK